MIEFLINLFSSSPAVGITYIFEILIAEGMFAVHLKRRKNFALRIILCLGVFLAVTIFLSFIINKVFCLPLIIFVLSVFIYPVCFDAKFTDILFCCVASEIIQNLAYNVGMETAFIVGVGTDLALNPLMAAVQVPVYAAVHVACYFICAKRIIGVESFGLERMPMLVLTSIIVVINYFLKEYVMAFDKMNVPLWQIVFICCNILSLFLLFGLFERSQLKEENAIMEQLLVKESKQYEISKKTIELINLKCHDLKHQLSVLMRDEKPNLEELKEIRDAINVYDHIPKTGNSALDVVLSEKMILCEQAYIHVNYMVDGECLSNVSPVDIASLYGNAIDNAMNFLTSVEDEKKRVISIKTFMRCGFIVIHIENFCDKMLKMANGLPITTSHDNDNHGFGLKSIKHIVEKYGGAMVISVGNNLFSLDITLKLAINKQ